MTLGLEKLLPLIAWKKSNPHFILRQGLLAIKTEINPTNSNTLFFIQWKGRKDFWLWSKFYFDKGGISMGSSYCPVCVYNKDKPETFSVNLFIMED